MGAPRYAHFRRFSWLTGVVTLWLLFASGIGGFWLVWDRLAQYSLIATTEWLDALPRSTARSRAISSPTRAVSDRFFSLLIFLHIGIPLALLALMWIHVQRLSAAGDPPAADARVGNARRADAALACAAGARAPRRPTSRSAPAHARARLVLPRRSRVRRSRRSPIACGRSSPALTLLLLALPWCSRAARAPRPAAAVVDLANCNGCGRCFADCPYAAVTMHPRTDGRQHRRAGRSSTPICARAAGSARAPCPSSTPFRSIAELVTGIDMPQAPIAALRAALERGTARGSSARVHRRASPASSSSAAGDDGGVDLAPLSDARTATLSLLCAAQLPPSFVDYALRAGADGVLVTGCRDGDCTYRLGNRWVAERLAGTRAPRLRASVPQESRARRVGRREGWSRLVRALAAFRRSRR